MVITDGAGGCAPINGEVAIDIASAVAVVGEGDAIRYAGLFQYCGVSIGTISVTTVVIGAHKILVMAIGSLALAKGPCIDGKISTGCPAT